MVLQFNFQHLYKHPVESVMTAYLDLCKQQAECRKKEDLEKTEEDSEMVCLRRKLTVDNYFSSFFQRIKLLKKDTIEIYEEIWSQPKERRYWVRTRNVTWENELTVAKTAYISPHHNPNWTVWDETSVFDLSYLGKIGIALEFYLKRKLEKNALRDAQIIDNVIKNCDNKD